MNAINNTSIYIHQGNTVLYEILCITNEKNRKFGTKLTAFLNFYPTCIQKLAFLC